MLDEFKLICRTRRTTRLRLRRLKTTARGAVLRSIPPTPEREGRLGGPRRDVYLRPPAFHRGRETHRTYPRPQLFDRTHLRSWPGVRWRDGVLGPPPILPRFRRNPRGLVDAFCSYHGQI